MSSPQVGSAMRYNEFLTEKTSLPERGCRSIRRMHDLERSNGTPHGFAFIRTKRSIFIMLSN